MTYVHHVDDALFALCAKRNAGSFTGVCPLPPMPVRLSVCNRRCMAAGVGVSSYLCISTIVCRCQLLVSYLLKYATFVCLLVRSLQRLSHFNHLINN